MKPSDLPVTVSKRQQAARRGRTVMIAVAFVAILSVTACGGSDSSAAPSRSTATVDEPAPTTTASVVDDGLEDTNETAASAEPDEGDGEEFIELAYWEAALTEGLEVTVQPEDECDNSNPDLLVCEWETSFESITTHLGRARDRSTGTHTTYLAESCLGPDGTTGHPVVREQSGTITAAWGDQVFFRAGGFKECSATADLASPGYVVIDGGTGRFEDAYGEISTVNPVMSTTGFLSVGVGTLNVRADLWEEILPQ